MAKKIVMLDDLDDSKEADETLLYLVDGEYWEIDLAADNAEEFRDAFRKYVRVSRPVAAKDAARRIAVNSGTPGTGASYGEYDPAVVRAWAQENGVEVSGKGRIPEHVIGMWRSATQDANIST
jgi:nucleoid-associated protein Lsr2